MYSEEVITDNHVSAAIHYQTFNNRSELDAKVDEHIAEHRNELNDTALELLNTIRCHSTKYYGVSYMKYKTIATKIGKSRMTVIRNIKKLVQCGIIKIIKVMRPVEGGNGSNLFIIQPNVTPSMLPRGESSEPQEQTDSDTNNDTEPSSSLKQNNIINNTYYTGDTSDINDNNDTHYSRSYRLFRRAINRYVNAKQRTISRLYGVYLAQTKYLRKGGYDDEELIAVAVRALSVTFHATKRKKIRNIVGYFSGTLSRMFDRMYEEEISDLLREDA